MNDTRDPMPPFDPADGSDEALSAYLLGELPEDQAGAFETLLARDPDLRARLDALADVLVALSGADEVEEPDGFAARLADRLDAERGVADLDERRRSRQRWSAMLTAAAGVVVLAVAGVQVLDQGGIFMGGQDMAQDMSMEESVMAPAPGDGFEAARMADDGQDDDFRPDAVRDMGMPEMESSAPLETVEQGEGSAYSAEGGGTGAGGQEDQSAPTSAHAERADGPVVLDEGAALETDDDLRGRYTALPESERLRGVSRDEAAERALRHAELIRSAEPFAGGVRPDACLDEVHGGEHARVVTRVERITWKGGETLAYVLAMPTPESEQVDRFELWLTGPQGCDTRRFLEWR